jgi:hypothetical protein
MGEFCDLLKKNNIDPDKFIAYMNECIAESRQMEEICARLTPYLSDADRESLQAYLTHVERTYLLDMMEKFVTRLERERIQENIRDLT